MTKRVSFSELVNPGVDIDFKGQVFEVYGLDFDQIGKVLRNHPSLIVAFKSLKPAEIVDAVFACGPSVVNMIIDMATGVEPGTTGKKRMNAFLQARIVAACIAESIPESEEQLEKFLAELEGMLTRFGVKISISEVMSGVGQKSSSNSSTGDISNQTNTRPVKPSHTSGLGQSGTREKS